MNSRNLLQWAEDRIKGFLYATPALVWMEDRVEDLGTGGFRYLWLTQIRKIIQICREEARKSASFGFIVRDEDLLSECIFYLATFNYCGGTPRFRERFTFETAEKLLAESIRVVMKEKIFYYVELAHKSGRNPNEIECHLQSVRSRILNNLWNDRLSPCESRENPKPLV
jgi:hypothetical protein